MRYSDLVAVAPRFSRAINLERDAHVPASIEGYVVTSTAADVIARLGRALTAPAGHRAWTLTGPYGSGKSAFALYLANLLSASEDSGGQLAKSILKEQHEGPDDPKAWRRFKKSRPTDHAIAGFYKQAQEFWDELMSFFPPLKELANSSPDQDIAARYRNREGGHLLFRPIGLSILAQVTKWFSELGVSLRSILRNATRVPMSLTEEPWVGLLWDPTNRRMIVRSENQRVAQRILYYGLGGKLSRFNSSTRQLREELAGLLGTHPEEVRLHRWAEL